MNSKIPLIVAAGLIGLAIFFTARDPALAPSQPDSNTLQPSTSLSASQAGPLAHDGTPQLQPTITRPGTPPSPEAISLDSPPQSASAPSLEHLLSLHQRKDYKALLEELRRHQYADPFFLEDLFQQYLQSENEADREMAWSVMNMLKDEAISDALAMAITGSAGTELEGFLRLVPETAAFSSPAVQEPVLRILDEETEPRIIAAALGTLNPQHAGDIDKAMVTSTITKYMASDDVDVRIAAYQQQARWFEREEVTQALTAAFNDSEQKVQIAAMSILEEHNIKDENFRDTLTGIVTQAEKDSELYLYSVDTLAYYYGLSADELKVVTGDPSFSLD